jgi:hypothetical protein
LVADRRRGEFGPRNLHGAFSFKINEGDADMQFPVSPNPPLPMVVAIGATVLVVLRLAHGSMLTLIVRSYRRSAKRLLERASPPPIATGIFTWAILLMLVTHLFDTGVWAALLNGLGLIPDVRTSVYMAASDYTTLGLADVHLGIGWRELNPIIAISGLFTFGWTTSVMFNVVGSYHTLLDELGEARQKKATA